MNKIYVWLFKKMAGGFVNKIAPGLKTFLVGFLTFIAGLMGVMADGQAYEFLCGYASFFCKLAESKELAEVLTFIGFLIQVLNGGRAYDALTKKQTLDPTYQ